jgi:hypothetical protein
VQEPWWGNTHDLPHLNSHVRTTRSLVRASPPKREDIVKVKYKVHQELRENSDE